MCERLPNDRDPHSLKSQPKWSLGKRIRPRSLLSAARRRGGLADTNSRDFHTQGYERRCFGDSDLPTRSLRGISKPLNSGGFLDTLLTTETLQERLTKMNVFVALTSAKQVVGTVAGHALSSEKGHLRGMAVLPSMLGNGVSAQLLGQAEAELQLGGRCRVTWNTTEPLERAMRFYKKKRLRKSFRFLRYAPHRI